MALTTFSPNRCVNRHGITSCFLIMTKFLQIKLCTCGFSQVGFSQVRVSKPVNLFQVYWEEWFMAWFIFLWLLLLIGGEATYVVEMSECNVRIPILIQFWRDVLLFVSEYLTSLTFALDAQSSLSFCGFWPQATSILCFQFLPWR